MPKRSTMRGAAPQCGQASSCGGRAPAGTRGCWIGGGGGRNLWRDCIEDAMATIMNTTMMSGKRIQRPQSAAKGKPEPPIMEKITTTERMTATRKTTRNANATVDERCGTGCPGQPNGDWDAPPITCGHLRRG